MGEASYVCSHVQLWEHSKYVKRQTWLGRLDSINLSLPSQLSLPPQISSDKTHFLKKRKEKLTFFPFHLCVHKPEILHKNPFFIQRSSDTLKKSASFYCTVSYFSFLFWNFCGKYCKGAVVVYGYSAYFFMPSHAGTISSFGGSIPFFPVCFQLHPEKGRKK